MHATLGEGREHSDSNDDPYWIWTSAASLRQSAHSYPPVLHPPADDTKKADADTLHKVFSALLAELCPAENLSQRGFGVDLASAARMRWHYRILPPRGRPGIVSKLIAQGLESLLASVPGFVVKKLQSGRDYWTIAGAAGMVIPVRDTRGRIVALKVRKDPDEGGKYVYLTSKRAHGIGPGSPIHVPLHDGATDCVRITEGELKADVATAITGILTVAVPGVGAARRGLEVARKLNATTVRIAFDADVRTNPTVARHVARLVQVAYDGGFQVIVETWSEEDGKGVDDVLLRDGKLTELRSKPEITRFVNQLQAVAGKATDDEVGDRRKVYVDADEYRVTRESLNALQAETNIFQRGGRLVHIVDGDHGPVIRKLPDALLREMLSKRVYYCGLQKKGGESVEVHLPPPRFTVEALSQRGQWDGIRHLSGVTTCPVLRPEGTLLTEPGYDEASRLFFAPDGPVPDIPENPTLEDVMNAVAELRAIVQDFPFETPAHESAWLGGLLSILARPAYDGPTPMFAIDANVRGSGKGLLCDIIGIITSGNRMSTQAGIRRDDEFEKRVTAIAEDARPAVLLDNITWTIGGTTIEALLTTTRWQGRRLGKTETVDVPLRTVWFCTGNNLEFREDTARRACHIRINSLLERPEHRDDFKIKDLRKHVHENRGKLLAAALTILRGWFAAGCPDQNLPAWGSFEGWSSVVRHTLVWASLPDPFATVEKLVETADTSTSELAQLHAAWEQLDPKGDGLTAADALARLHADTGPLKGAKDVICGLGGGADREPPSSRQLGRKLGTYRGRVLNGRRLDAIPGRSRMKKWVVNKIASGESGESG